MRHLGYTRVSTRSQDAKLQVDALVKSGVQERDIFADVTSGSRTAISRPGMKKLLEYAKPGDTVVVWRVDRLGRSLIDVLNTVKLLRERDVQVKSISDGIDPSTTSGRLMLNMLATLAEYERELITERVNAGITAARKSGTRFGRPLSDPVVVADKLTLVAEARAKGRTAEDAAKLVGWSRATLYRHQQALVISTPSHVIPAPSPTDVNPTASSSSPLPRIGAPATRALADRGVLTLEDLEGADLGELAKLHGVGPKAIQLLRAALDRQPTP